MTSGAVPICAATDTLISPPNIFSYSTFHRNQMIDWLLNQVGWKQQQGRELETNINKHAGLQNNINHAAAANVFKDSGWRPTISAIAKSKTY